jgi:tetratricopeptide (TPR) repeat protein
MGTQLDFSAFINDRTRYFTGREWVFAEIDRWLADSDGPSFFIITGEPGIGKSAIAARLTQVRDLAAYHFCIACDAETIDPALFAQSLSGQLCRIDGFARGILKDSNIDLKTTQNVQANYGQVIGAKIENLVLNAPSGAVAFTHAVLQPLKALCADGYGGQVVLLVDALDEAVQHKGSETIVDLLANGGALPRQVRFVLTSRLEGAALQHFEQRRVPHFRLDAGRPENLRDIGQYVRRQLEESEGLHIRLADEHTPHEVFVERVATASHGNFLYVVWLLRDVAAGIQCFDTLEALPQGLDGIYREFLRTRTIGEKGSWRRLYRPILGALVAAQAPLTAEQVGRFAELSSQDVDDGLQDLRQFLDPASADEDRHFVYHQSVNDWLQDRDRSQEFWIDVMSVHQHIVSCYRQNAASWREIDWDRVDQYGFSHLTGHLFALRTDPVYCQQLYGFVCQSVMLAKRSRTGADSAFATDVDLMLEAAVGEQPTNWVQMGRASLLYATLGSLATTASPAMLGSLAACGQVERALAYAELVQDSQQRFDSCLRIGMVVVAQPELGRAAALLERALSAAEAIQDDEARSRALSQVAQALAQAGQPKRAAALLERALSAAEAIRMGWARSAALSQVAQALAQAGQPERALSAAEAIQVDRDTSWALSQVAQALAQAGQPERALSAAEAIQEGWASSEALSQVAQALAQAGQPERAAAILKRALASAQAVRARQERAKALCLVADGLIQVAQAGSAQRSLEIVERYLASIETLKHTQTRNLIDWAFAWSLAQARKCAFARSIGEGTDNLYIRAIAQMAVAGCLQQTGQAAPALAMATAAAIAARSITGKQDRVTALTQAAQLLGQLGDMEQAGQLMDLAISSARQIKPLHQQSIAASQIARVLAALSRPHDAQGFATSARDAARSLKKPATAIDCLAQTAVALADIGRRDEGLSEIEHALGLAQSLKDSTDQARAWSELARALVALGDTMRAANLAKEARSKLTPNGLQPDTATIQAHVAHSLDMAGLHDQALEALQSAVLQARYDGRDSVLEVLAEGAPILAALIGGETVWRLYEAIQEIDGWWSPQPSAEAKGNRART